MSVDRRPWSRDQVKTALFVACVLLLVISFVFAPIAGVTRQNWALAMCVIPALLTAVLALVGMSL